MKCFHSIFKDEIQRFLQIYHSSGKKIQNHLVVLGSLDSFLVKRGHISKQLDEHTVSSWLSTVSGTMANKVSYIARFRGFSKFLNSLGFVSYEPEYPRCPHDYAPYIFSDEEWMDMIRQVDSLPHCSNNPESAVLFSIFLRILYGCGLRKGEALGLEIQDIDLDRGTLFIRHSKNDKQRYVPMSNSLTEILRQYLKISNTKMSNRKYLFTNVISGNRYSNEWARKRMRNLLHDCGIIFARSRAYERGPCLHCLRHTFVARSFNKLLDSSFEFEDVVPFISTYLGHSDLRETDKYLQANYEFYHCEQKKINEYVCRTNIFPEVIDE